MSLVKYAARTYLIEFGAVAAFYAVAAASRPWLEQLSQGPASRILAKALPVIPIWLMLLVIVRYYRHVDERQRLKLLENGAVTAGVLACLATSYALIGDAGFSRLALTWAWPTLATCCGLAMGISALRNQ